MMFYLRFFCLHIKQFDLFLSSDCRELLSTIADCVNDCLCIFLLIILTCKLNGTHNGR